MISPLERGSSEQWGIIPAALGLGVFCMSASPSGF